MRIVVSQIDSPRWSVEIARRFPRDCIYGRIVLARLLLKAELYEWVIIIIFFLLLLPPNLWYVKIFKFRIVL